MIFRYYFLSALCSLLSLTSFSQHKKEIIVYYPNWRYYERDNLLKPANLKYDRVTTINYAFFAPEQDGSINGTDAWADTILLRGESDNNGGYEPGTSIIELAHKSNVKVLVSIGGWASSKNFPAVAADASKRKKFANECVRLIKSYGFDGIDMDWEYPGYKEHNGTSEDKQNFTLLLLEIRKELDALGKLKGIHYPLTAAVSASDEKAQNMEVEKITKLLDYFNIMTYDFTGPWEKTTGYNSSLYADAQNNQPLSVDQAFRLYNEKYKVPASKINLGLAFYGRTFADCKGPWNSFSDVDKTIVPAPDGMPNYYQIATKMDSFNRYWDAGAKVPYLLSKSSNVYITYDDVASICHKATYVMDKGAAGVIIWEITGDYIDKNTTPLQDKINEIFNGKKGCDNR